VAWGARIQYVYFSIVSLDSNGWRTSAVLWHIDLLVVMAATEELLEAVICLWLVLRLYCEGQLPLEVGLEMAVRRVVVSCETVAGQ
jgi:hypothetical protein